MTALATVHRGVAFEKKCLKILQEYLSMSLRHVGGKSDGGIDLIGWWWLPTPEAITSPSTSTDARRRLRVLAQCKAEKKKIGPNYIREMEGVFHRHVYATQAEATASLRNSNEPLVALFLSESQFTKSTILHAMSSPFPFFLLHLPPSSSLASSVTLEGSLMSSHDDEEMFPSSSSIGSAIWNPALGGSKGLLDGLIDIRWERSLAGASALGRPGLWTKEGNKIPSWTPVEG